MTADAIARLNRRSEGRNYLMAMTGSGLFLLRERVDGQDKDVSEALPLDDFVRFVDAQGAAAGTAHHPERCRLRQTTGQETLTRRSSHPFTSP